ncbi:hypothetical protein Lalb_Chr22g0349541 [Lupinus albus]|uniref:Uncharacterized protein n=1 Tax=Lupinus albus TaxID=3870 RepID=A0A6A4NGG6_LUPAL|nr:hypothetical protein Lalb_Chr22g0349541 [Lupinus albus]
MAIYHLPLRCINLLKDRKQRHTVLKRFRIIVEGRYIKRVNN